MKDIPKTNAARLLDRAGIVYRLVPYEVDESDLSAVHVAVQLGEPVEAVYKTIVLRGDRTGHFVCVIPADAEIDLKKAARASGNKKADTIPMKELLPTTGYIRGGCTAIGLKKPMPVFIQEDVTLLSHFYVSAGKRGLQLCLTPDDYIAYTNATVVDLKA